MNRNPEMTPENSGAEDRIFVIACLTVCAVIQAWLVFNRAMNWDEFLHFSQIYQLRNGTLTQQFQVLHSQIFKWIPDLHGGVIAKMEITRLFYLASELLAVAALVGLVRNLFDFEKALLAGLAYLTGGYVVLHGFSIRPDPMAAAVLMSALYILSRPRMGWRETLVCSALLGLSGMLTVKSVLYAPCFAGLAIRRLERSEERHRELLRLLAIPLGASVIFYLIYAWHSSFLNLTPGESEGLVGKTQFLKEGLFLRGGNILRQGIYAPLLALALLAAPVFWRRAAKDWGLMAALAGLYLPILSLIFYRNTYPYFFVFLLPPLIASASPALEAIRKRIGTLLTATLLMTSAIFLTVAEPRDIIGRQRAVIDHIHELFPEPTPYLSYSGMVADYPRVIKYLTSGLGMRGYQSRGIPIIANRISDRSLGFIIADQHNILGALVDEDYRSGLLPQDVSAMRANFAHHAGPIWLRGRSLCPGDEVVTIATDDLYTLEGQSIFLDGRSVQENETIKLEPGQHELLTTADSCSKLWNGPSIPKKPAVSLEGPIYPVF